VEKIRGVFKVMPAAGAVTAFAVLGMVGMPAFNASISKYFLMYEVTGPLFVIMNLINLGTITVFIRYGAMLFGPAPEGVTKAKNDRWKEAPLAALGLLCLGFGIFGVQAIQFLFGWNVRVDLAGYLEKSLIFATSAAAGYLILKYVIKGQPVLARIRDVDLGFRGMCAAIGVFFAVVLVVSGVG
jgi:formate hydrogenlyase subunit 3/multisubunit Na+/H+ antiporter MnhD subunit